MFPEFPRFLPYVEQAALPDLAERLFEDGRFLEALFMFGACDYMEPAAHLQGRMNSCLTNLRDNRASASGDYDAMPDSQEITDIRRKIPKLRNRIALYTAQFGDYDILREPERVEEGVDYYFFTDNRHAKSRIFNIIHVDDIFGNPRLSARRIKALAHIFLEGYERTIWIDSAILLRGQPILSTIGDLWKHHDMLVSKHKDRDCLYAEAEECSHRKKDIESNIAQLLRIYHLFNLPENIGLSETAILLRADSRLTRAFNELWWLFLYHLSPRDQLSFDLLKGFLHIKTGYLPDSQWNNKFSRHIPHGSSKAHSSGPDVEIIIPVNEESAIDCVNSLFSHTDWRRLHVTLVDNITGRSVKKRLAQKIEELPHKIRIIPTGKKLSWGQCCCLAMRQSTTPLVLFAHEAMRAIRSDWIGRLWAMMIANMNVAVAAPMLLSSDYEIISAGIDIVGEEMSAPIHLRSIISNVNIKGVSPLCFLGRRVILEEIPCSSETFSSDGQELARKLKKLGYRCQICHYSEVICANPEILAKEDF